MTILREQFDGDRAEVMPVAEYRSTMNRIKVPCSVCGRALYVGSATKNEIERAIEHDLNNPLMCSECERNFDMREPFE